MKYIFLFGLTCLLGLGASTQSTTELSLDSLPERNQTAFGIGEELEFTLSYGFINAGKAVLTVNKSDSKFYGREVYHIVGEGKTTGAMDFFFKVRDRYETYIDTKGIFPWKFVRRVNEGGYKINQDYFFQHQKQKVKDQDGKEYTIPVGIQDMLSVFYFARTFDYENAKPGDIFEARSFVDGEVFPIQIKMEGTEYVNTDLGRFLCHRFIPMVQEGRVFKGEEDLHVWITADKNHIPVLVEAEVLIGSVTMELSGYKKLNHPIAKK